MNGLFLYGLVVVMAVGFSLIWLLISTEIAMRRVFSHPKFINDRTLLGDLDLDALGVE